MITTPSNTSTPPDHADKWTPLDAHAHYYSIFDPGEYLDAAVRTMAPAGTMARGLAGVLLLAEPRPDGDPLGFWRSPDALRQRWTIDRTDEETSLIARRGDGARVILVAGRQLTSTEGLEVLALAMDAELLIRRPLQELIDQIRISGGIPVIPWGFGKWWGSRGRVLMDTLAGASNGPLFLGDSACRPTSARNHPVFKMADERGIPLLPGSDPLPLPSHARRAGTYGFLMQSEIDQSRPAAAIRSYLTALRASPPTFGQRESALAFMVSQISLRMAGRRAMLQQQQQQHEGASWKTKAS